MQPDINPTTSPRKRSKYFLPVFVLSFILMASLAWYVLTLMVTRHVDIASTRLVLKSEACQLLQHENVYLTRLPGQAALCSVTAPYRADQFGSGGVLYLEGRPIHLANHQLVSHELVDPKGAIQAQVEVLFTLLLSTGVLMGLGAWLLLHNRKAD